jgi:dihydropteroate synthase
MRRTFLLQSGEKKLPLGRKTCIMAVLNITPDSFSDGGNFFDPGIAVAHAEKLLQDRADILDIGGQSTRPGAQPVGAEEELRRILPILSAIRKISNAWISIDTYRAKVARVCLEEGADMINDVSSFRMDPEMAPLIASRQVPVVCMHFLKSIHPMPSNPEYQDLFREILLFFRETLGVADSAGIKRDQIIVDPGIGFGKALDHNLRIMKELNFLNELERPILVGPSRKSFIEKITGQRADDRLEGTAAAVGCCVLQGAHVIRVHDAEFFRPYCDVLDSIINS